MEVQRSQKYSSKKQKVKTYICLGPGLRKSWHSVTSAIIPLVKAVTEPIHIQREGNRPLLKIVAKNLWPSLIYHSYRPLNAAIFNPNDHMVSDFTAPTSLSDLSSLSRLALYPGKDNHAAELTYTDQSKESWPHIVHYTFLN